jgi:hypothetical protein
MVEVEEINKPSVAKADADNLTAIPPDEATAPETKSFVKQTKKAKKKNKMLPTISVGELLPWKGVWWRVVGIDNGILQLQVVLSKEA